MNLAALDSPGSTCTQESEELVQVVLHHTVSSAAADVVSTVKQCGEELLTAKNRNIAEMFEKLMFVIFCARTTL